MNKKFSIALSLAMMLALLFTSLVLADIPPAHVLFTTDLPCAVEVDVFSYTTPANQPGQSAAGLTSLSQPWLLDTYPFSPLTFGYQTPVVCNGVMYNLLKVSSSASLDSAGDSNTTTTITGQYIDTTAPTLHLPADMTVEATDISGAVAMYSATADDLNPLHPVVACMPPSGSTFGFGTTPVNCSATDAAGNTANGGFTVTVQDTTPPTVTPPPNMTVETVNASGVVVMYSGESASDTVDGALPASCVPASGSAFPPGTTTVTCTATDTHGNTGTASFFVTVVVMVDTTPPVLTLPADMIVPASNALGAIVDFAASANDAVDGPVPVLCTPASGSNFPFGVTTVICSATDSHGNQSSGSFTVTVEDITPPVLTLPDNKIVPASNASGTVVDFVVSANDAVDGPVPMTCSPVSGWLFPIGTSTVTCSAKDSHGNQANGSFTVTVQYATAGTKCGGIAGHEILQPINTDGSSVFKMGSDVPAKFRVCGADGKPIGASNVVTIFRLMNSDATILSATSDTAFRSGNGQWIFNIDTKNLTAGNTYIYQITLNDGSTIQFQFTLK